MIKAVFLQKRLKEITSKFKTFQIVLHRDLTNLFANKTNVAIWYKIDIQGFRKFSSSEKSYLEWESKLQLLGYWSSALPTELFYHCLLVRDFFHALLILVKSVGVWTRFNLKLIRQSIGLITQWLQVQHPL